MERYVTSDNSGRQNVEPAWRSFTNLGAIPDNPLPLSEILDRVSLLLSQSRNLTHPGFMANMEPMPSRWQWHFVSHGGHEEQHARRRNVTVPDHDRT
jgi:hypothetical protein